MELNLLLLLIPIILLAYSIKGLTGFGPALIIVPFFTAIIGVQYALPASALFDAIAGLLLLIAVYKKIYWKFCLPLMITMAVGSFIGANAVFWVSPDLISILIGIFIFIFAIYLWIEQPQNDLNRNTENQKILTGAAIAGFFAGISGGLIGMSGPILVIYLKHFFSKDFFRNQLIVIFLAENLVRTSIYYKGGLLTFQESKFLFVCLPALILGLWIGNILHIRISEKLFNRVVSLILILVSVKIIIF
jgi:uncharacterized membrane protein YfcA